jgi:hypothetical protein
MGFKAFGQLSPVAQECKKGLCSQVPIQKAWRAAKVQVTKYFRWHY